MQPLTSNLTAPGRPKNVADAIHIISWKNTILRRPVTNNGETLPYLIENSFPEPSCLLHAEEASDGSAQKNDICHERYDDVVPSGIAFGKCTSVN